MAMPVHEDDAATPGTLLQEIRDAPAMGWIKAAGEALFDRPAAIV
jgi:hypothetical protein